MSPDPNRRRVGDRGEELALRYLGGMGYALVGRNYRTRSGEIDLILRDGGTLVFVEVKLRRGTGYGDPLEAVTPRKQARIRLVAEEYLAEKGEEFVARLEGIRFDAVGILVSRSTAPEVRHITDAF